MESIGHFGQRPVITLNRFPSDSSEELERVLSWCEARDLPCAISTHFANGGQGAVELAELVMQQARESERPVQQLYDLGQTVPEKVECIARKMYGARDVAYTKSAERDLRQIERLGYSNLPVCVAKTPSSLSDDPKLHGRPRDFDVTVRAVKINAGAGFLVVLTGDVLRMPGLPRVPQAQHIDVIDSKIEGLR